VGRQILLQLFVALRQLLHLQDDPLPPTSGVLAETRPQDTIKDLNRRQGCYLVHFKGDGTGTRIGWELPGGQSA
jgi:hypothetical protein